MTPCRHLCFPCSCSPTAPLHRTSSPAKPEHRSIHRRPRSIQLHRPVTMKARSSTPPAAIVFVRRAEENRRGHGEAQEGGGCAAPSLTAKSVYDWQQCSPTLDGETGKNGNPGHQAGRSRSRIRLMPSGTGRHCQMGASMTRGRANKSNGVARPIKTKKDYSGAASVLEKISGQPGRETVAEKRLQSLLKEMEKFDGDGDEPDEEIEDDGYAGPRRRWSDESTDSD